MNHFIGVDPDLHDLPLAIADDDGVITHIGRFRQKGAKGDQACLRMIDTLHNELHNKCLYKVTVPVAAYAVEGQCIYPSGPHQTPNPNDIKWLATVAGAACMHLKHKYPESYRYLPLPMQWKGSRPKQIHHRQIMRRLGWEFIEKPGYCAPREIYPMVLGVNKITISAWKHIMDAIGLALWCRDQYHHDQRVMAATR